MSAIVYDSISNLRSGRHQWNIKVRVLRIWRFGNGETAAKAIAFNLLLLDDKDSRIHAFIANDLGPIYESTFKVDHVYTLNNFTVNQYTDRQKPYPIEATQHITLTKHTIVVECNDAQNLISNNAFDFYDLADLEKIANQENYLTDVIGVVEGVQPLRRFTSHRGKPQTTVKFCLTDGKSRVNVTLWADYAEKFVKEFEAAVDQPVILIISSAKVGYWHGVLEVGNWYFHSSVYLNYKHHSVASMRKRVRQPSFAKYHLSTQNIIDNKLFKVAEILKLTEEYIGKKIVAQVDVKKVKPISNWLIFECTSCQGECEKQAELYKCTNCGRDVTFVDMKFRVVATSADDTGRLQVVLKDRDVQRLTETKAYQERKSHTFPAILKKIEGMKLTILLHISEDNVKNGSNVFFAAEVAVGNSYPSVEKISQTQQDSTAVQHSSLPETGSSSSLQNVHLTNLNLVTPPMVRKSSSRALKKPSRFQIESDDED